MNKALSKILFVTFAMALTACNNQAEVSSNIEESSSETPVEVSSSLAPETSEQIVENQLSTASGLKVNFNKKGARIDKITLNGKQIAKDGFTVGRVANRIANGKFTLNGKEYNVTKNSGNHSLHGGGSSWQGPFANANWTKVDQTASTITFSIQSKDGAEGYPGNMTMTVKYTLSQAGELSIEYTATSDADTLCNPTNHLFMAVNGNNSYNNINLWINADKYTPLKDQIPTGEIADVAGTQFDYSTEKAFDGSKSYDDNYVLKGEGYRKVATLTGTSLGLKIDVFTDRAGLQLYKDGSGNICLETQQFPDMINHPEFAEYGTTILRANETFTSKTTYQFTKLSA